MFSPVHLWPVLALAPAALAGVVRRASVPEVSMVMIATPAGALMPGLARIVTHGVDLFGALVVIALIWPTPFAPLAAVLALAWQVLTPVR